MTVLELQKALNKLGASPKLIEDGKMGKNTINSIKEFQRKNGLGDDGIVGKYTLSKINALLSKNITIIKSDRSNFSYLKKGKLITQAQLKAKYGNPCDVKNLVTVTLPFPLKLSWANQYTNKIQVHKSIATNIVKVFQEILDAYGLDKIKELGINIYGGAYNCRQMRTSKAWSVHSFGLAIDLDPQRNGLNVPFLKSQFSKLEYKKMHEIFYKYGFVNLGIEANMDSMHFQVAQ